MFYPKGTSSFGTITGNLTAQAFDSSVSLADTQAYWSVLYGNTCGEEWLEENVMGTSEPSHSKPTTKSPTPRPSIEGITSEPTLTLTRDPASASGPADSWTGELPWTIYGGPGGCEEKDTSTVAATGTAISLEKIAPEVLCETDQAMEPGSNTAMTIYTKFTNGNCGSETAEFVMYKCEDNSCSKCNETPEAGEKYNSSKEGHIIQQRSQLNQFPFALVHTLHE